MRYDSVRELSSAYRKRGWKNIAKLIDRVDEFPANEKIPVYLFSITDGQYGFERTFFRMGEAFLFFRHFYIQTAGQPGEAGDFMVCSIDEDCRTFLLLQEPGTAKH